MLSTIVGMASVTPDSQPNLDYLGPIVTTVGLIIVAIISAISAVWRRRQDREDKKLDDRTDAQIAAQPKVIDGWDEVREARQESMVYYNLMSTYREMRYVTLRALRGLVRAVRHQHPDYEFDQDVIDALELKEPEIKK